MTAPGGASRRAVLTAAWAAPVLAIAAAAPARSASGSEISVALVTTALSSNGVDLYLRETKTVNSSPPASSSAGTALATTTFVVTDALGARVSGATVRVSGGALTDGEGNFVIGVWAPAATGPFGESPIERTVTATTDALGEVTVKLSTATWSRAACAPGAAGALRPPTGVLTVTVVHNGVTTTHPFSYLVYDASPFVIC